MSFYTVREAAEALAEELADLTRLREQERQYEYSTPEHIRDSMNASARRVRDAVRYLVSDEANE